MTIAKQNTFNPVAFRRDFQALAEKSPARASGLASSIADRLENALLEAETLMEIVLESSTLFGTSLAVSMWCGAAQQKRDQIVNVWNTGIAPSDAYKDVIEARDKFVSDNPDKNPADVSPFKDGGLRDPTTLLMLPLPFWTTAGLSGAAYLARDTGFASTTRAAALGSLAALGADVGRDLGVSLAKKREEKKDDNES